MNSLKRRRRRCRNGRSSILECDRGSILARPVCSAGHPEGSARPRGHRWTWRACTPSPRPAEEKTAEGAGHGGKLLLRPRAPARAQWVRSREPLGPRGTARGAAVGTGDSDRRPAPASGAVGRFWTEHRGQDGVAVGLTRLGHEVFRCSVRRPTEGRRAREEQGHKRDLWDPQTRLPGAACRVGPELCTRQSLHDAHRWGPGATQEPTPRPDPRQLSPEVQAGPQVILRCSDLGERQEARDTRFSGCRLRGAACTGGHGARPGQRQA